MDARLEFAQRERDLFVERIEEPVVGENRGPRGAVEGVVGLDEPRELVLDRAPRVLGATFTAGGS
jgi:hypothetical protein